MAVYSPQHSQSPLVDYWWWWSLDQGPELVLKMPLGVLLLLLVLFGAAAIVVVVEWDAVEVILVRDSLWLWCC